METKEWEGIEITHETPRLYHTNKLGDHYRAIGEDEEENKYELVWEIINEDCEDESDACDWDLFSVVAIW